MALSSPQFLAAQNKVCGIGSYEELLSFYKESFGANLAAIAGNSNLSNVSFRLVQYHESQGTIDKLLQAIDAWNWKLNNRPKPPIEELRNIAKTHLGIEGLSSNSPILAALTAAYNLPKP
jgi:hypothetical protein